MLLCFNLQTRLPEVQVARHAANQNFNIIFSNETTWILISIVSFQDILTHLPLDKMAVISQTIFSYAFSKTKRILIKISLKLVPKGLINNNTALV